MRVKIRRRRVTQRCDAFQPSPSGCGGRGPSPASLLLDVPQGARHRRRSLDLAPWRSQRGSREVLKPALRDASSGDISFEKEVSPMDKNQVIVSFAFLRYDALKLKTVG